MKKKILITVLACVLVAALSIGGTLAYLTAQTDAKVNTFVAGNIGGTTLTITEQAGQSFTIVPGTSVTKDPRINIGANTIKAIAFVKVVQSNNWDSKMTYGIDSGWKPIDGSTTIYYRILDADTSADSYPVLLNNTVSFAGTMTPAEVTAANNATLTFTAYISQYDGYASTVYTGTEAEIAAHIFDAASFA